MDTDTVAKSEGTDAPAQPQPAQSQSDRKIGLVSFLTVQPIRIKSGPVEVVGSGMVIPFSNNSLEILIGVPNPYRLIVIFEEEDKVPNTRIGLNTVDSSTVQLTCFNFKKQPTTVGNSEPMHIGVLETRPFYLNFRVQPVTGSDPIFFYTLYAGEAANGK